MPLSSDREGTQYEQIGPEATFDHLKRARDQQQAYNNAWLSRSYRQTRLQRVGFAIVSAGMLATSSLTLLRSLPGFIEGNLFMPPFSAFLVVASAIGLKKAVWPGK